MTADRVKIADRWVGPGERCYIVAEAGSNHDGDLSQARKLVEVAASVEADAVKFQTFRADRIVARTEDRPSTLVRFLDKDETVTDLFKKLELPFEWHAELRDLALSHGMQFLSTPFDEESADFLMRLGVPAFKVASYEVTHLPLIQHIAHKGLPMIVSTGMATMGEIEEAVDVVRAEGAPVILLHCAVGYPPKAEDVNLAAMDAMRAAFGVPVGFSDHTKGTSIPIAAVARGASVVEKHFTLSRTLPGPDHHFACEPDELKAVVQGIREVEAAIGEPRKGVAPGEKEFYRLGRRSVFAARDVPEGTTLGPEMLVVLRPGTGLPPKYLPLLVGKVTRKALKKHEPITWDAF